MTTLVEFLRARLAERETKARAATHGGKGVWTHVDPIRRTGAIEDDRGEVVVYDEGSPTGEQAEHIVANDPARVLAEVEAKRQIIELHAIVHRNIGWQADGDEEYGEIPVCGLCVPRHSHYRRREDVPEGPCQTVRLLALPYVTHPDYREEWRP